MKTIKLIVIMALFAIATTFCKAQDYATVRYWGKDIKLDRSFFEILNNNYAFFIGTTAPQWKYYDGKDYEESYVKIVDNLKSPQFFIIVTEANQLNWYNSISIIPGTKDEQGRSKKSTTRAIWLLYQVVLPSLQQFAKYK